jgi:hypothetical protein
MRKHVDHSKLKFEIDLEFVIWGLEFEPCLVSAMAGQDLRGQKKGRVKVDLGIRLC